MISEILISYHFFQSRTEKQAKLSRFGQNNLAEVVVREFSKGMNGRNQNQFAYDGLHLIYSK